MFNRFSSGNFQGFIYIGLEQNRLASAHAGIGSNDHFGLAVFNPAGQRIGRKTAKHHTMHRANPGTGQHRNCGFRNHWHIQHHPVAFFNPVLFQHIGKTAGLIIKFVKGNNLVTGRVIAFPDNGRFIRMFLEMTVQTVGTEVQLPISEPFNLEIVLVETGIFDLGKRFDPVQLVGLFSPIFIRLRDGFLITLEIFRLIGASGFFKFFWYRIDLIHCLLP